MNPVEEGNKNKYFSSDRIFELAQEFGLKSDYSISKACGVKQPTVSYWRKKSAMISLWVAINFCKSVGISYSEYLGEKPEAVDDSDDGTDSVDTDDGLAWSSLSASQKKVVRAFIDYIADLGDDALPKEKPLFMSSKLDDAPPKEEPLFISSNEDGETKRKTLSVKDENGKEWIFTVRELAAARELLEYIRSEERFFNKPYIKPSEAVDFYSIGENQFKKLAKEAGAFFKFAKSTIVCREDFESYIKIHYRAKRRKPKDYWARYEERLGKRC
jgi:hypothetical protein